MFFFRKRRKSYQNIINNINKKEYSNSLEVKDLNLWVDGEQILSKVNVVIPEHSVVAIIGPSGSGKSSFLRAINKTNFGAKKFHFSGEILFYGEDILPSYFPVQFLRTNIVTVLQKPVMFPMSIRENVLFALKSHGVANVSKLEIILEKCLREAHLWDEVKDRLNSRPEDILSIGQQQRLCIARAIALEPKVLLMDEPTSALDLKASGKIESLIKRISSSKTSTILLVSHSLEQVKRVADYVMFIKKGSLVEFGKTKDIFTNPQSSETREFLGI